MTDEEIKQNAQVYAGNSAKHLQQPYEEYKLRYDAYTAGAHSRDEEIKELEERIHILELGAKVNEYFSEAKEDRLRNPWISVEDRLPEEFKPVIVMFDSGIIINAFVTMVKDEPAWHPSVEIPIGSDVIFWMPIPELKKGE